MQTILKDDNEDEGLLDAGDDYRPVSGHFQIRMKELYRTIEQVYDEE